MKRRGLRRVDDKAVDQQLTDEVLMLEFWVMCTTAKGKRQPWVLQASMPAIEWAEDRSNYIRGLVSG